MIHLDPLWLLGLVVSVLTAIATWFIRTWFEGVKESDREIASEGRHLQAENHKDHVEFRKELHALDRRLIMLEGTIPELKLAIDRLSVEFKEAVDEISTSLKDHVAVEERWQREIAAFMGKVKGHLELRSGKRASPSSPAPRSRTSSPGARTRPARAGRS